MAQLAILGHPTRGNEVIEILEMLGGKDENEYNGSDRHWAYMIDEEGFIDWDYPYDLYNIFTLEKFLEKFPYKVGDKVQHKRATSCSTVYEIEQIKWEDNQVKYIICDLYWKNCKCTVTSEDLQPYKEETMEEKKSAGDMKQHLVEVSEMKTDKCFLDWRDTDNCLNCKHFVALVKTKDGKWKVLCETKKSATELL